MFSDAKSDALSYEREGEATGFLHRAQEQSRTSSMTRTSRTLIPLVASRSLASRHFADTANALSAERDHTARNKLFPRRPAWTQRPLHRLRCNSRLIQRRIRRVWPEVRHHGRDRHRAAHDTTRPKFPPRFFGYPNTLLFREYTDEDRWWNKTQQPRRTQRIESHLHPADHRDAQKRTCQQDRERHAVPAQSFPKPGDCRNRIHASLKCSELLVVKG